MRSLHTSYYSIPQAYDKMRTFFYIIICIQLVIVNNNSFAQNQPQTVDTVYFSCSFGYLGLLTKNIEIKDINNNQSAIITNYHGRYALAVPMVIYDTSDTLIIKVKERFKRERHFTLLVKDIKDKYIWIYQNEQKEFEFEYRSRKHGGL